MLRKQIRVLYSHIVVETRNEKKESLFDCDLQMWTLGLLWVAALSHTMIAASPLTLQQFLLDLFITFGPIQDLEAEAFLLSRDVRAALALLAAVPQRALGRVRVHWLLELVRPAHADTGRARRRGRPVSSSTVSTLLDAVDGGRGDDIGMQRHGGGGVGKGYFEANSTSRGGPGGKIGKRQRGDAGDGESGFYGSMGSVRDETDDDVGGREERDIGHHVAMAHLGGGGERRGGRSHCGGKIEKELHLENSSLCSVSEDAREVGSLSERHGEHITAGRGDEISRGGKGDRHGKNIGLKGKNRDRSPESFPSFAQKDRKKSTKGKLKANATPGGMSPNNKRVPAKNSSISDVVEVRPRRGVGELDWAQLDSLLDWMHARDLALGFELMGNPAGRFRDLARPEEARAWRRFVARLLRRYLDRYGSEAIARWRFETWNEPDLRKYNTLNFTLPGFARYARASAAGLRAGAR
ncbi:LOW QUALITY PROTEIN: Alpha-L-iduronidase, partial [Gryllus bimaculatus]